MPRQQNISVPNKFRSTISKYHLVHKGDKIIVGLSGGPDSVALLYLLNSLKKQLNLKLHIAHLDHMLRPDSGRDKAFVEQLALRLDIPFSTAKINLKKKTRYGSLEESARNARLGFFFRVAKNIKADKIALGHNLDDQAETVLMRLLRGTGLYGLAGILPKRKLNGYTIIRPLIKLRRKDIERFLRQKKVKPCLDASNFQEVFLRNRIRNRLLPLLEKEYNKNIREVLSNTAESIGYDYDYLNRVSDISMRRLGKRINLKKFLKLHLAIQRLILRLNISRLKGDMRRLTFGHIKELEDLILNRPVNSIVDLPAGISAIKKKKYLEIRLRNST